LLSCSLFAKGAHLQILHGIAFSVTRQSSGIVLVRKAR
jgi:hypothetical protein